MEIKDFRHTIRMSQRAFAAYFGIPLGTLRNWEQGIAKPPEYVLAMLHSTIRRDKMINIETIKFMQMLDELAAKTVNRFIPFSAAAASDLHTSIVYDETKPDENGFFPIVHDACIVDDPTCLLHDIISYYDSDSEEYTARVDLVEGMPPSIVVDLLLSEAQIAIYEGKWHFA